MNVIICGYSDWCDSEIWYVGQSINPVERLKSCLQPCTEEQHLVEAILEYTEQDSRVLEYGSD